jgi:uncharacterized protein (TIGR02271 family)
MSEGNNLGAIGPGTPVYGPGGEPIGPVEAIDSAGIRVLNRIVPPSAITRIDDNGVYLRLAYAAFEAASPMATGVVSAAEALAEATTGDTGVAASSERIAVPLAEERLAVGTRQVQVGEVLIDKRVVEEQVMVPVVVRREEIEIIRRAPGEPREEIDDPSVVEVIRIPLRGEVPEITTRAVVTGEVVVSRTVQADQHLITRTVRSTDVSVEERVNEAYARSRPEFEEHFAHRQQFFNESDAARSQPRTFADAEPNYRAGFRAGRDERYVGRTFEEIEPELRLPDEPAKRDPGMFDQIRDEVRMGFARARTMGAE